MQCPRRVRHVLPRRVLAFASSSPDSLNPRIQIVGEPPPRPRGVGLQQEGPKAEPIRRGRGAYGIYGRWTGGSVIWELQSGWLTTVTLIGLSFVELRQSITAVGECSPPRVYLVGGTKRMGQCHSRISLFYWCLVQRQVGTRSSFIGTSTFANHTN